MNVRVGVDVLYTNTGQKVGIAKVVVHPQYEYIYNDIAVVELKTPLQFNDKIQPIKLPKDNETLPAGTIVDVSGYGFTQTDDYNNTLQAVAVPIIDNDECNSYYSGHVKDYMICAGLKEGGKDACQVRMGLIVMVEVADGFSDIFFRGIPVGRWRTEVNCLESCLGGRNVRKLIRPGFIPVLCIFCRLLGKLLVLEIN